MRNNNFIYNRTAEGIRTAEEPLGIFFNIGSKEMSDQWNKGFAVSSLYVPMETNLYDANSIKFLADDTDWVSEFYYKYAFYRKALYINTESNAISSCPHTCHGFSLKPNSIHFSSFNTLISDNRQCVPVGRLE